MFWHAELGTGGVCILLFLGGWFLVSIPHQFNNRLGRWVKLKNVYGLIPGWTYFAPVPGTSNYRFVYRDKFADESLGEWEEVRWCSPRRVLDGLWHPRRHRTKLVVDSIGALSLAVDAMAKQGVDVQRDPQSWIISTPYVLLMNIAMAMPRQGDSVVARQFVIVEQYPSAPERPPKLVVSSPMHEMA